MEDNFKEGAIKRSRFRKFLKRDGKLSLDLREGTGYSQMYLDMDGR